MQVNGSKLMLLEEYIHALFKEGDLVHEKRDIKLLLDFFSALIVDLHPLRRDLDAYVAKKDIETVSKEV